MYHGLEVSNTGDIYVAFQTTSNDLPFQGNPGILNPSFNTSGFEDLYVARFNEDLTTLEIGGYLGGDHMEGTYSFAKHPTKDTFALFFETYSDQLFALDRPAGDNGNQSYAKDLFLLYFNASFAFNDAKITYIPRDAGNNIYDFYFPSCTFINDTVALAFLP